MRPQFVVVPDVLTHEIVEVAKSKGEEAIEALSFDRSDPPLNEGILIRCSRCRWLDRDIGSLEDGIEPVWSKNSSDTNRVWSKNSAGANRHDL